MGPAVNLTIALMLAVLMYLAFRRRGGWVWRWRKAQQDPERVLLEDGLKHLYQCREAQQRGSLDSLAGALEIRRDVAARLADRLERSGFVTAHRAGLGLTDDGLRYALRVVRTHRLWERYLADETGIGEGEWHERADRIEHELTPDEANALSERMGNPAFDPHGDPIPSATGAISTPAGIPLASVAPGTSVRVVHVEDEPDVIYRQLVRWQLEPGMALRVLASTSDRVEIDAGLFRCDLAPIVAANVTVEPLDDDVTDTVPRWRLSSLSVGQQATVSGLSPSSRGRERRRLLDLGLVPGTLVRAELPSPGGDPMAYRIRGALIALRKEQADRIHIDPPRDDPEARRP